MNTHELVIDEEGRTWFRCNAKPEGGKSPECWWSWEDGEPFEDTGRGNAGTWIDDGDCMTLREEIVVPVDVIWTMDDGPVLAQKKEGKR
ncbi:hypothetical protein [Ferrimicrobium acidiphilum]|uniref:hypothetical protein n=1 Tax=Ferrimicrobium acidiphilum TaxID=121039 RepID=UPI0023F58FA5|nr:hypothetical protein [Ferrimicrobium acidiphilum]